MEEAIERPKAGAEAWRGSRVVVLVLMEGKIRSGSSSSSSVCSWMTNLGTWLLETLRLGAVVGGAGRAETEGVKTSSRTGRETRERDGMVDGGPMRVVVGRGETER
jgi:hypothetical protein